MDNKTNPSLYSLMEKVLTDTTLTNKQKIDLIDELRKNNPVAIDRWGPRVAIWILGAAVITTIICITYIAYLGGKTSEGLIAIGSAAVGGLAGLISQVSRKTTDNQL